MKLLRALGFGLLVCAALAGCSSKADRIASGLRKGGELVQRGEWDKASVEIRNVLQMDPKNAQAYLLAGQVDDGRASPRSAFANYTKALDLRPDDLQARLGLARLHLLVGETVEAKKYIDQVLLIDHDNVRATVLNCALAGRSGRLDEAVTLANRIVSSAVQLPPDSALMLAGLYFNAKDPAAALRVLDKALATEPKNAALLEMAAEVASDKSADASLAPRALAYFRAATAAAPANDTLWNGWARWHLRLGEVDRAEAVLRDAMNQRPDDIGRVKSLLGFVTANRKAEVAEKAYADAIAARPKETTLRFAQVEFLRRAGRSADAEAALQAIVQMGKDAPAGVAARSQLAAMALADGRPDEAKATLAEVLKVNPHDTAALALRGRIALGEGRPADAVTDLRVAMKDQQGSADIVTSLWQAHRALNEPQLAREALVDAAKFNPSDPQLILLLAADKAANKDYAAARSTVDEALKLAPQYRPAYEMQVELAEATGDHAAAERSALEVQRRFPGSPTGYVLLGRIYANHKRGADALKQFEAGIAAAPRSNEPWLATIGTLTAQHRFAEALARIDELRRVQPKSRLPNQLTGEVALAQGDLPRAESAFIELCKQDAAPVSAFKNLTLVRIARKDTDGALAALTQGEKAHPADLELPSLRARMLAQIGRVDEAVATYEALLRRAPQDDAVANDLAFVLSEVKGDAAGRKRALEVASRFEGSSVPGPLDTLGMVHYRNGGYAKAVALLRRAVDLAPAEPLLQLHLGMALVKNGDAQHGRQLIRKAMDSRVAMPNAGEAQSMLAQG